MRQVERTRLASAAIMRDSIICGKFTQHEAFPGVT